MDPRVKRTKKMFKDALKELMLIHDDYMEITVKELCEKAGLSRRTFYLHYEYVDDVLLEIDNDYTELFIEMTKQYDHIRDIKPVVRAFFDLTEANPIYEKMLLNSSQDYLRESLRQRTVSKLDEDNLVDAIRKYDIATQHIIEQFYHNAVVTIYREWARKKKVMPKERVVDIATQLISQGLNSI